MKSLLAALALFATLAFSQVTTSTLDGTVTDPQGALIVGAEVLVTNAETGQTFKATTDERGHWLIPSMAAAAYRATVSQKGFRTSVIDGVKVEVGVPATLNVKLEIGQMTETVEVTAGAEMVQTTNAALSSTVQGRQIFELPFTSRNPMELLVTQAGTQSGTTARNSYINGLPWSAINITTDGINTQDNYYKSGDGFFSVIPVRTDSVDEVTMTTSAAGVDSLGQGAAQIKFVTKSGTNAFHGGAFWQHRNTALNANYYFNNINGSPRDKLILNNGGVHIGGPAWKNKLFFFTNYEISRLPISTSATRTVMDPGALNGAFTYNTTAGNRTVNLLQLAGANGFTSTADPLISNTLSQINALTKNGIVQSRTVSNNDYNRNNLIYQPTGMSTSTYDVTRLDYNLNSRNTVSFVWTYYVTDSTPDITNSVVPIFPGTGTVLGSDVVAGQRGNRYAGVASLRSSITNSLTNEFRAGMNRAVSLFRDQVSSPALFSPWRGYATTLNYVTSPQAVSGSSRRNSPVKQLNDNLSWLKGNHLLSFGGEFTQVNFWYQSVGTAVIPGISFSGIATGDPINTGSTGIFTTTNFPGASSTQLGDARNMYAMLTGRVTSISRSVVLNGDTHQYGNNPQTDINRQREWGVFLQDTWRVTPSFTLSYGVRFEQQKPFDNLNGTYSAVSQTSTWGVSGPWNFFRPGYMPVSTAPVFDKLTQPYNVPSTWSPSLSFAWQTPGMPGFLGKIFGQEKGKTVLRAGYSLATIREGTYVYQNLYGSNVGVTNSTSVDPGNYPTYFGSAGSVLFRDATLPSRPSPTTPNYPIAALTTNSLNAFDPNLKMGYVQSWNLGLQREVTKDTVIEVRYTGNHGLKEWRQVNVNEVNIFENGFLNEFTIAQNNLAIANGISAAQLPYTFTLKSNNFGNAGLAGQQNLPIISTALGTTNDATYAQYIRQNRPATLVNNIYSNVTNFGRLTAAGYPKNMFVANPDVAGGGSYLLTNLGSSFYDAMQLEFRRRMKGGLFFQGSYVWSKSIVNGATSSLNDYSSPITFRNIRLDRTPADFDIRHAFKINSIYELPLGPGRRFLSSGNPIVRKALEGWEFAGVGRVQTGTPFQLNGGTSSSTGRWGMTLTDNGIALYNMTTKDLQSMMQVRKVTGSNNVGQVFYLPQSLVDNTNAAFEVNSKTLDPSKPYIGPQIAPGQFGYRIYLYGPHQTHIDLSVVKHTRFKERGDVEFRANFLDAFNLTNFQLANGPTSTSFGQTTTAFRDFSGTNDPGARIIEFVLRVNF